MPNLDRFLILSRCPHCQIDSPSLEQLHRFDTENHTGGNKRYWGIYECKRCGGVTTAAATTYYRNSNTEYPVKEIYPSSTTIDASLPPRAKAYLEQAVNSLHAPAGSIMLAASSIDSMLKSKGLTSGNLYSRIGKAAKEHLITPEMAEWAHEVRLEANDQRHADDEADLPTTDDAQKVIDFTLALAQFLFVLPSRVERGIQQAKAAATTEPPQ